MKTIFLHMPKCAGSSMRKVLKQKFKNNYIKDYQTFHKLTKEEQNKFILDSIESPKTVNKDAFVFGHFYPVKYLGQDNFNKNEFRLITFLREPLERLASHYSFWTNSQKNHYLWRKNIYLSTNIGRLLVIDIKSGKTISTLKVDNDKISRPFIMDKNLYLVKDNAIIKLN